MISHRGSPAELLLRVRGHREQLARQALDQAQAELEIAEARVADLRRMVAEHDEAAWQAVLARRAEALDLHRRCAADTRRALRREAHRASAASEALERRQAELVEAVKQRRGAAAAVEAAGRRLAMAAAARLDHELDELHVANLASRERRCAD